MLKDRILDILSPLLYRLLSRVLTQLKPLFLNEDEVLREQLMRNGFHPALCAHPSILFGYRSVDTSNHVLCLSWKVVFLRKAIYLRLFKSDKGHALMQQLGIDHYYGNGLDFWFVESHTPIKPYTIPSNNTETKRIAIYTALTGDYDDVNEILYKENAVDYLLFTNNRNLCSSTWQVVYVESELDNLLLSREIKMLPHKYLGEKYEASIYIDANAVVYGELSKVVNYLSDKVSFAVSKHSERKSVKEEIDTIVQRIYNNNEPYVQYERYVKEGFDDNSGLAECGLLVRKHNDKALLKVMESWWKEFQNGIRRDQISILPVIQRLNFKAWQYMDGGSIWHNQFCKIIAHKI